jgi:hypothetical protein
MSTNVPPYEPRYIKFTIPPELQGKERTGTLSIPFTDSGKSKAMMTQDITTGEMEIVSDAPAPPGSPYPMIKGDDGRYRVKLTLAQQYGILESKPHATQLIQSIDETLSTLSGSDNPVRARLRQQLYERREAEKSSRSAK